MLQIDIVQRDMFQIFGLLAFGVVLWPFTAKMLWSCPIKYLMNIKKYCVVWGIVLTVIFLAILVGGK